MAPLPYLWERKNTMKKPILILKIGTAAITRPDGSPDEPVMVDIARQVARLHPAYRLVIVSSGAVGTGRRLLRRWRGSLVERKAAAAIGNPLLLGKYAQFLAPYGIALAQTLCERQHFSRRAQFLQLRDTIHTLWKNDIIPIANENDVVSNLELKFSDNDELATLLAVGLDADRLLLGTSVPGVLDSAGQVVRHISTFDDAVLGLARAETSGPGLGGMVSKLTFARLATRLGIEVVIFGVREPDAIWQAAAGQCGTFCAAASFSPPARRRWLASGSLVAGRIEVDAGAGRAVQQRRSLLGVGVTGVQGDFVAGEVVELALADQVPFAVARTRLSAPTLASLQGSHDVIVAHADEIVLLS